VPVLSTGPTAPRHGTIYATAGSTKPPTACSSFLRDLADDDIVSRIDRRLATVPSNRPAIGRLCRAKYYSRPLGHAYELSAALTEDLTAQRTAALRAMLADNSAVPLVAVVHALALRLFYEPFGIKSCLSLKLDRSDLRVSAKRIGKARHCARSMSGTRHGASVWRSCRRIVGVVSRAGGVTSCSRCSRTVPLVGGLLPRPSSCLKIGVESEQRGNVLAKISRFAKTPLGALKKPK
jgi:hypothetical protein